MCVALAFGVAVCLVTMPRISSRITNFEGFTVTEYRKHYPFDVEDGGLGKYESEKVCLTKNEKCYSEKWVLRDYPETYVRAPWMRICDGKVGEWQYFSRKSGAELKCSNCDADALRCPNPPQNGTWFDQGNKSSELVGYAKENRSTIRVYAYSNDGVKMHEFPILNGVAYGAGEIISEWFYGDKSRLAWIQCNDNRCVYYNVDFNTGESTQEATPCDSNDDLTLVLVDNRPEIRVDFEAKGDEICRNAEGKLAYPLGPERDRIVYPLRVDPPVEALDVKPAN
jgi:hypothetical protein